jgi:hypothetical protein
MNLSQKNQFDCFIVLEFQHTRKTVSTRHNFWVLAQTMEAYPISPLYDSQMNERGKPE